MSRDSHNAGFSARWNLLAAAAAWLLPGLGHFLLGQRARGVVLATTIGTLWLGGLLIGGISIIDRDDHPVWFLGQLMIAPSILADRYHHQLLDDQSQHYYRIDGETERETLFEPAYARAHEQGTLFTCVAGLLNLLAMLDVIYRDPTRRTASVPVVASRASDQPTAEPATPTPTP